MARAFLNRLFQALRAWWKRAGGETSPRALVGWCLVLGLWGLAGWLVMGLGGREWREALAIREAAEKGIRAIDYGHWGLWWSGLVTGVGAWLLLAALPWWRGRGEVSAVLSERECVAPPRLDGRFLIALGGVLVLALLLRLPRMDLSLYNDEAESLVRNVAGEFPGAVWKLEDEAVPEYRARSWPDTLWRNRVANNHILQNALARVALSLEGARIGAVPGQVIEWPLRLPALFGGLLSILGVGVLARELGMRHGALLAPLLLAIHPWHLRYSTEARGYGLLFAFVVLLAWCAVRALRSERPTAHWLVYGLIQGGVLLSNLGAVYYLAALNGSLLLWLLWKGWRSKRGTADPAGAWRRAAGLLAANLFCLLITLPFLLPGLPQMLAAMRELPVFKAGLPAGFALNLPGYLIYGMPVFDGDPDSPHNPALLRFWPSPVFVAALIVFGLGLLLGAVAMVCRGVSGRLVLLAWMVGLALPIVVSRVTGSTLLPWYVIYVLPLVVLTVAGGFDSLERWLQKRGSDKIPRETWRCLVYVLLVLYVLAVAPAVRVYQRVGKQPLRDIVMVARQSIYPFETDGLQPVMVGGWIEAGVYDPTFRFAWTPEKLRWARDKAIREGRPLYFVMGGREAAVAEEPETIRLLEESGWFEPPLILYGLEEQQYQVRLFVMKTPGPGGGAGGSEVATLPNGASRGHGALP